MDQKKKLPIFERRRADDGALIGYQVKIRKAGWPAISKQFDRIDDARRFAIATIRDMDAGLWIDRRDVDRLTLREAIERYITEIAPLRRRPDDAASKARLWLATKLSDTAVSRIKASDLAKHRDARIADGKSGNTVRLELGFLSRLFEVGIKEWGWAVENPVRRITPPRCAAGRERRLRGDEEARLFAACDESKSRFLGAVVRLAIETGMRRGEILSLGWDAIDMTRRTAHLSAGQTKTEKSRTIPLSTEAIRVLSALPRQINGRVFQIKPKTFGHTWARAVEKAGIKDLHFHDLRHEATSRLFERGFSITEVASITGHQSLAMLKRYTHHVAEDLARKML